MFQIHLKANKERWCGLSGYDVCCDGVLFGKVSVSKVKEGELCLAPRRCWPVHIVVTPKKYVSSLAELVDFSVHE